MTKEEIYRDLRDLQKHPQWATYVARIKEVIAEHEKASVFASTKAKAQDAQRQAWIAEGLLEAIEDPESVVRSYEFSVKGIVQKAGEVAERAWKHPIFRG